jgi:hypothetical protein
MVAYVVAACLAMVVAAVELRTRLTSRPTVRGGAWAWWSGRLALDAAIGLAAVTIVGTAGRPQWLTGLIAGVAGSAFVRWQVAIPGSDGQVREVGIARAYDPLRSFFESAIADIGAVEQQTWISDTVLPALRRAGMSVEDLGDRLTLYVQAMTVPDADGKERTLAFIKATVEDASSSDEKVKLLVIHAVTELQGYRVVKRLVKTAQTHHSGPSPPPALDTLVQKDAAN